MAKARGKSHPGGGKKWIILIVAILMIPVVLYRVGRLPHSLFKKQSTGTSRTRERQTGENQPGTRQTGERQKVFHVVDGDTVVMAPIGGGRHYNCRLYGIDAPETPKTGRRGQLSQPGQPYGEEASRELEKLILGAEVYVTFTGERSYGREICLISFNAVDVNKEMVRRGYAWAYRHYLKGHYASEYIGAEREARNNRLGLWQQLNPTPPWEFRARLRSRRETTSPFGRF